MILNGMEDGWLKTFLSIFIPVAILLVIFVPIVIHGVKNHKFSKTKEDSTSNTSDDPDPFLKDIEITHYRNRGPR